MKKTTKKRRARWNHRFFYSVEEVDAFLNEIKHAETAKVVHTNTHASLCVFYLEDR